jgi:hypothetical protein
MKGRVADSGKRENERVRGPDNHEQGSPVIQTLPRSAVDDANPATGRQEASRVLRTKNGEGAGAELQVLYKPKAPDERWGNGNRRFQYGRIK